MEEPITKSPGGEPAEMKPLQRIIAVFINPAELFKYLNHKPDWVLPFVIILVSAIVVSAYIAFTMDYSAMMRERFEKMVEEGQMTQEQADKTIEAVMEKAGSIQKIITVPAAVLGTAISLLVLAAVLYLITNLVGGNTTFVKTFSVLNYAALVETLGGFIAVPIMISTQNMEFSINLGALVSFLPKENIVFLILSAISMFTLWKIILLGIGIKKTSELEGASSYIMVFALYALWIAGRVALMKYGPF